MNAPTTDQTLDGAAPDTCPVALLLIDVVNDFEYPGGDRLFEHTPDSCELYLEAL